MSKTLNFLGVAATLAMAIGSTGMAQAASVTTSGTWTSVTLADPDPSGTLSGVGTSQVEWGVEAGNGKSGYNFTGLTVDAPLDGSSFLLGTFTHNNFPIFPPSITGANLAVNFTGAFSKAFNFAFNHNETPNPGNGFGFCPDTPAYGTPCPDIVSIPSLVSQELVSIGGFDYNLTIEGFKPDANSSPVSQFITIEGQANSAGLYGKLVQVQATPNPVPEPMTILASTAALAFGGALKRKQSQAKKEKVNA